MGDKTDEASSPSGQGTPDRKITKPLMEKRRRARINSCLTELKALLLTNADEKESGRFAKLEKADILELTVKYLRNRQQSSISGSHTALYRAGFNKCMEELSTFLSADDDHSANLRLKLTSHLAEILCSMDRLKDASSRGAEERSDMSPVFQVSSSSEEMKGLSRPASPTSRQMCQATAAGETQATREQGTRSPESERFKHCSVNGILPSVVNANGSLCQTLGVVDNSTVNIPTYTTIPVLPTVVTPGQVLLLVPNNNNSSGKLSFQLPAFTPSSLNQLCQPRDFHPMTLTETVGKTSQSALIDSSKIGITDTHVLNPLSSNSVKLEPTELYKKYPFQSSLENNDMANIVPSIPAHYPISVHTSSDTTPEKAKPTPSPDSRTSDRQCEIRNDGFSAASSESQGAMWRPW